MFSVVIPMYNGKKSIIKCIESVLNQTRLDLIDEVIVVNDGSTDGCDMVLKEYLGQGTKYSDFVNVINIKNSGVSAARNIGIMHSSSEWIAFLDCDDVWKENKTEKQFLTIKKYSNIKFLGGNRDGELHTIGNEEDDGLYSLDAKTMLFKPWPHTSTIVVKKDTLVEFGNFDTSRSYCEDIQLWMKIANKYKAFYLYDSLEFFGDGKPSFGFSGLSANLKKMHEGMVLNVKEAYKEKYIGLLTYVVLLEWEQVKYFRRILLTKMQYRHKR